MNHFTFFHIKSLESDVKFTFTAHVNLGTKFSSEILDLSLDFAIFTTSKIDSCPSQTYSDIFQY